MKRAIRKTLSLLLIVCLALSLCSAAIAADEAPTEQQTAETAPAEGSVSPESSEAAEADVAVGAAGADEATGTDVAAGADEAVGTDGAAETDEAAGADEPAAAGEPASDDGEGGFRVTFVTDGNATVNVFYGTDYAAGPAVMNVSSTVGRSKDGKVDYTGEGQANFEVVPAEGYAIDSVTPEGGYNKLKLPDELGFAGVYRLTKVSGAVTVTITTKPASEVEPTDDPGDDPDVEPEPVDPFVTFVKDENATVNVYYGQDYTVDPAETDVTSTVARTKDGTEVDTSGSGQVNFEVVPAEGYAIADVSAEGEYNKLNGPSSTGVQGVYRLTKVSGAVTVTVTLKELKEGEELIPNLYYLTPEGYTDSLGTPLGTDSLKLKSAGTYTVIGKDLTDYVEARIQIQSEGVKLILEDVQLTWTNGAAINAKFDTEIEVHGVCRLTRAIDAEADPTDDGGKVIKGEGEVGQSVSITITGNGTLDIDAPKKGIGVDVLFTGWEFENGLDENGMKRSVTLDSTVIIDMIPSDGIYNLIINAQHEAIEANIIRFLNGNGYINSANNDGINVGTDADDEDEDDVDGDGNVRERLYPNVSYKLGELGIYFEGGEWYIESRDDGIDSNGSLVFNGGTTVVFGPTSNMNSAADYGAENGGVFSAEGGTLLAVGSSGMQEMPEGLYVYARNLSIKEGDRIAVLAPDGNELINAVSPKTGPNAVLFCSPDLVEGETYTIVVGDSSVTVQAKLGEGGSGEPFNPGGSGEPSGDPSQEMGIESVTVVTSAVTDETTLAAMKDAVTEKGYDPEQADIYEVKLQDQDGNTLSNNQVRRYIQQQGGSIQITLPLPADASAGDSFMVLHGTSNRNGQGNPGGSGEPRGQGNGQGGQQLQIREEEVVSVSADGITITITGLSPFAVVKVGSAAPDQPDPNGGDDNQGEPLPEPEPEPLIVKIAADGKSAQITGDYTGLYARLALTVVNDGETGLYIAQCRINADGSIYIPVFDVAGLKVTGISVALVSTPEDITSRTPAYKAMDYLYC